MANRFVLLTAVLVVGWIALAPRRGEAEFHLRTLEGEVYNRESLKGRVVLLQFWTTWCGFCRAEQTAVDEMEREYAGRGVVVLAVNVNESRQTVRQYLASSPRACRIVLTEDTNLTQVFAPRGFPSYVVIDREGRVAGRQSGAGGAEGLRRLLAKAGAG
jgi:cytochrome c biogenesis protein CcmG/thiol:disulfide interchange protein DsbE